MATMNVSLPDEMKEVVEAKVRTGQYANASDYMRDLIRRDNYNDEWTSFLLRAHDEGLASGIDPRTPKQVFADLRARYDTIE